MRINLPEVATKLNHILRTQGSEIVSQPERLQAWMMDISPDSWRLLLDVGLLYGNPTWKKPDPVQNFELMMKHNKQPSDEIQAVCDMWLRLEWEKFPQRVAPPNRTLLDDMLYRRLMEKMHQRQA